MFYFADNDMSIISYNQPIISALACGPVRLYREGMCFSEPSELVLVVDTIIVDPEKKRARRVKI